MSFVQAVSGLNSSSYGLDIIGNNLANASTVGFKNSRAEFADIYSSYLKNEAGHGAYTPTAAQQFVQGNLATSNNPLDFSINGNGMFRLSNKNDGSDRISYTRNGEFHFEPVSSSSATTVAGEKYIVNANGNYLMGWPAGVAPGGDTSVLKIVDSVASLATTTSTMRFNLDDAATAIPATKVFSPTDPSSFNWTASQEVFSGVDDDAATHSLALYFAKTSTPDTWNVYSALDGVVNPTPQTLTFTAAGLLSTPTSLSVSGSVDAQVRATDPLTGAVTTTPTPTPMTIAIDLSNTTEFASGFDLGRSEQNGYVNGRLSDISLSPTGGLMGTYSNGRTQEIAKVALAAFQNPNGLQSIGDNLWLETTASGSPTIAEAGKSGMGVLASNSLESSNVDISAELIDMITMQRNYQANAQMVKAQDELLKTLTGLR